MPDQRLSKTGFSALERQKAIYLAGISGKRPAIPIHPDELERQAKDRMTPEAFAYVAGSAGLERTAVQNSSGFSRWQIVPRMLRDVSRCDLTTELLGMQLPAPLLTAPIGVLEMAHRQADLAVGRAAATLGIPMIFSNQASVPMEKVAEAMEDGLRWFQLYWSKSNELVASFAQRAEACGCRAIVITLDTTMLGWRMRDLDMAYLPFLRGKGIAQYTSDPVFQHLLDEPDDAAPQQPKRRLTWDTVVSLSELLRAYPGNWVGNLRSGRALKAVRKFINIYTNPTLNWNDLAFLRQQTKLPILLKGILHADDARIALDHGINGLIVSNHGGRQVDGAIAAIEALPNVVAAVNGQIPVLMDSGIRSGADVFKALALGAKAVCVGRPYVYGLALNGEAGVREVLENLLADFELTMRLAGCRSIGEITPEMVSRVG
ncbi:MAG: alpha-hydroxy-acid oxidizing protein [Saprospiraceae bacterium]|nr:alpha-hydroxy-acid oxidizing protein [Saprospiraceae bacterium]